MLPTDKQAKQLQQKHNLVGRGNTKKTATHLL